MSDYWEINVLKEDEVLEVKVNRRDINHIIWIVPLIAIIVGGWMIYKYYANIGPQITITFQNSAGLEPKHSHIKFRDVTVGVVDKVEILKDREGVIVTATMNKDVKPFLNKNTKFWIVKPEIGLGKVKGLDALMSGTYIQMYSKAGDDFEDEFKGYQQQPIELSQEDGKVYKLFSRNSFDLTADTPVYYKQRVVGKIQRVDFNEDGTGVDIYIFVNEKYTKYINQSTRFWNIENIDISLTDSGINIHMNPLIQLLLGGIEFYTKDLSIEDKIDRVTYTLYPNRYEALRNELGNYPHEYVDFILNFKKDSQKLALDSPIYFKDFQVGYVKNISSVYNIKDNKLDIKVLASINIASFKNSATDSGLENLNTLVKRGLRAKLDSKPLFGGYFVKLDFDKDGEALEKIGKNFVFPTAESKVDSLLTNLSQTLTTYKNLAKENTKPLKGMLTEAKDALKSLKLLLSKSSTKKIPKNLNRTLVEFEKTLSSFKKLSNGYSRDSMFGKKVEQMLKDIDKATKDLQNFVKKVKKKPNMLIFGD